MKDCLYCVLSKVVAPGAHYSGYVGVGNYDEDGNFALTETCVVSKFQAVNPDGSPGQGSVIIVNWDELVTEGEHNIPFATVESWKEIDPKSEFGKGYVKTLEDYKARKSNLVLPPNKGAQQISNRKRVQ